MWKEYLFNGMNVRMFILVMLASLTIVDAPPTLILLLGLVALIYLTFTTELLYAFRPDECLMFMFVIFVFVAQLSNLV